MFTPEINRAATEAFQNIFQIKGREILKNPKSVRNLISDFLPGYEYESARNIIRIACEWDIFALLLDESIPAANRAEYAARQMQEKAFISVQITREVVSWAAVALGLPKPEESVCGSSSDTAHTGAAEPVRTASDKPAVEDEGYLRIDTDRYGHRIVYGSREKIARDNVRRIVIPDGVDEIGSQGFEGCSGLVSVSIPNSVKSIGDRAFRGCSGLSSVTVPRGVVLIGTGAFRDCSNLSSVTVPDSVRYMEQDVFLHCGRLRIHCAHTSQPSGWEAGWNPDNCPVTWKPIPSPSGSASSTAGKPPTKPTGSTAAKPTGSTAAKPTGSTAAKPASKKKKKKKSKAGLAVTLVLLSIILLTALFITVDWEIMQWVASPLSAVALLVLTFLGVVLLSVVKDKDSEFIVGGCAWMFLLWTAANVGLSIWLEEAYRPFGICISIAMALFLITVGLLVGRAVCCALSSVLGAFNGLTAYLFISNRTDAFLQTPLRIAVPMLAAAAVCFMLAPYRKENYAKRFLVLLVGLAGGTVCAVLVSLGGR